MDFFIVALKKLSSVSGLLSGFNLSVLCVTPSTPLGTYLDFSHILLGCFSVGSLLLCLVMCNCLVLWCPGLALQGAAGTADIDRAIRILDCGLDWGFVLLSIGVVTHFIVCLLTVLSSAPSIIAVVVGAIIASIASVRIIVTATHLLRVLLPSRKISAKLTGNPVQPQGNVYTNKIHHKLRDSSELHNGLDTDNSYNQMPDPELRPRSMMFKQSREYDDNTSDGSHSSKGNNGGGLSKIHHLDNLKSNSHVFPLNLRHQLICNEQCRSTQSKYRNNLTCIESLITHAGPGCSSHIDKRQLSPSSQLSSDSSLHRSSSRSGLGDPETPRGLNGASFSSEGL